MSRRIIFAALAASAALIATQAIADRECFEDSCRVPEAAEPPAAPLAKSEAPPVEPLAAQARAQAPAPPPTPTQAQPKPQPSAAQASAVSEPVLPEITVTVIPEPAKSVVPPAAEARAESKLAPGSVVLPKVVTEPAQPKIVAEPAPRHAPPRGRNEVEPPGVAGAEPPADFSRNWSASSDMNAPATIVDPETYYRPDVVIPYDRRRRRP